MNLVFDLDGTLIDSAPDIRDVASSILLRCGREPLTLTETRDFMGEGAAVFIRRMMFARAIAADSSAEAALHDEFVSLCTATVERTRLYAHAFDILLALKDSGHRLGLCTNKPEAPTRAVLGHLGIEPLFDAIVTGGMLDSYKPEPAMLLQTIDFMECGPALYIGDSEVDAEAARRAHTPFVLHTRGYRKSPVGSLSHNWAFDSFELLPGIARRAETSADCAETREPLPGVAASLNPK